MTALARLALPYGRDPFRDEAGINRFVRGPLSVVRCKNLCPRRLTLRGQGPTTDNGRLTTDKLNQDRRSTARDGPAVSTTRRAFRRVDFCKAGAVAR